MPVQISIEHGNEATDAQLKEMRDKDIFFDLTPTFYGGFLQKISEQIIVISAASRRGRQFRYTPQTAIRSVG
jgi:hypothetical protein